MTPRPIPTWTLPPMLAVIVLAVIMFPVYWTWERIRMFWLQMFEG